MNKIVLVLLMLFLSTGLVFAKSKKNNMPVIKFNGAKYTLMYSAKSDETGGYLNEYYKKNQTYASWSELIGVHHYPTSFYPIVHAKEFAEFLNSTGVVANVEADEKNNSALVYFVVMDKNKLPIIMEFNVFKYEKSPICGTVGIQYAKRYRLNNPFEIAKTQKDVVKQGLKYIKKVVKLPIPEVITFDVEKGKYVLKEGCNSNLENLD